VPAACAQAALPAYGGCPLGSVVDAVALVLSALNELGHRSATLWVLTANARARSFYEQRGWQHDQASKERFRRRTSS
jgi:hypothetical protein